MPTPSPRWAARAALVAAAALIARPLWLGAPGTARPGLSAAQQEARAAAEEGSRLDAAGDATRQRIAVRRAIAVELAGGRITLAEATVQFLRTGTGSTGAAEDEERAAALVIVYAVHYVAPPDREAAARRWADERHQTVAVRTVTRR